MVEWQNQIKAMSRTLLKIFNEYFQSQLIESSETKFDIKDEMLGAMASSCTTLEAALSIYAGSLFNDNSRKDTLDIVESLVKSAHLRQHEDGALGQPFYIIPGEKETKDIAEIGASADALYYLYKSGKIDAAKDVLIGTASFLDKMKHPEVKGVYYKRPDAIEHDVLNGDAYAGASLMRTYQVTGDKKYHDLAADVAAHLIKRFGVHTKDWWPYSEFFDGSVNVGNSLGYQATIIAFGHDILSGIEDEALKKEFSNVLDLAMLKIIDCIEEDLSFKQVEPVWWGSPWNRSAEVLLALIKQRHQEKARKYATVQLTEITENVLGQEGISYFIPPKKDEADPNRTPVSTTFRKVATMAGIISYAYLDLLERE
ncbi:MAG: hypothetical protein PHD88_08180 [Firmicutes bacterium]|nr:hypothetical protein [Bacillota bacterium]MDD4263438.1 hypothetical protein [Bacillota bacterium]MDD4694354.1 hypothetical protein [Bacillota bacterium]